MSHIFSFHIHKYLCIYITFYSINTHTYVIFPSSEGTQSWQWKLICIPLKRMEHSSFWSIGQTWGLSDNGWPPVSLLLGRGVRGSILGMLCKKAKGGSLRLGEVDRVSQIVCPSLRKPDFIIWYVELKKKDIEMGEYSLLTICLFIQWIYFSVHLKVEEEAISSEN